MTGAASAFVRRLAGIRAGDLALLAVSALALGVVAIQLRARSAFRWNAATVGTTAPLEYRAVIAPAAATPGEWRLVVREASSRLACRGSAPVTVTRGRVRTLSLLGPAPRLRLCEDGQPFPLDTIRAPDWRRLATAMDTSHVRLALLDSLGRVIYSTRSDTFPGAVAYVTGTSTW